MEFSFIYFDMGNESRGHILFLLLTKLIIPTDTFLNAFFFFLYLIFLLLEAKKRKIKKKEKKG